MAHYQPSGAAFPLSRPRRILRAVGAGLLLVCAAMVGLGLTIWSERLQGESFVVYWSWCFLLAVAAILVALVDMVLLGRAYRRSRRALFEREFMTQEFMDEVRAKQKEKPNQ